MNAWLQFAACAALIVAAGPLLIRKAHDLASMFGWSRTWVGGILLASATSLPELVTGISSVSLANAPNIAVGDALGSCIFNLALIAMLDVLSREDSVFSHADQGHVLTAALGSLMIGTTGAGLLTAGAGLDPVIGHVSGYSLLILMMYVIIVRAIFMYDGHAREKSSATSTVRVAGPVIGKFTLAALVVGVAGMWLPFAGTAIAAETGWGTSFVATLLLAAATSFPELVVAIAALRMRSVDIAIAGLLGSNIFDVAIIAFDDLAYLNGSLFSSASPANAGTAFGALIMSSVVIVAIVDRPKTRVFGRVGWISVVLGVTYALSAYSIYLHG